MGAFRMDMLAAAVATSPLRRLTEDCCQIFASHCFSLPAFSISSLLQKQQSRNPIKYNRELGGFLVSNKAGIWLAGSLHCNLPGDMEGERAEE